MADTTPVGGLAQTPSAATEEKDDSSNIGTAKAQPIKIGKNITLPAAGATAPVPESVLENLQKMYDERLAKKNSFMENMRDATAWWSGGVAGPSEALAKRAAERESEAGQLFQMQNAIAQYKAQQEANKQTTASLTNIANGVTTVQGPGGSPIQVPPMVAADIQRRLKLNDLAGAQKSYDDWFKTERDETIKMQTSPGAYEKKIEVERPDGSLIYVDSLTARQMYNSGSGTPTGNTKNVPTTTGNAAAEVKGAGIPVISGDRSNEKQWQLYDEWVAGGRKGNPVARPGTSKHETGNAVDVDTAKLTADQKKWLADNGYFQPLPGTDPNHWEKRAAPAAAPAAPAATTTTTTTTPGAVSGTARSQQVINEAGGKAYAENVEKELAPMAVDVTKAGRSAGDRFTMFSDAEALAKDKEIENMLGLLQTKGITPFVLKRLESGVNAGQFGAIGMKDLQKDLAEAGASDAQIAKFLRLEKHLKRAELEYAQTYLKGQGAVSDAERELVRSAVGSLKDPAKVLQVQMAILRERAAFDNAMNQGFIQYKNKKGRYASFSDFLDTQGQALIAKHNQDLSNILGVNASIDSPYKGGETPKSTGGATADEKKRWNERYGNRG